MIQELQIPKVHIFVGGVRRSYRKCIEELLRATATFVFKIKPEEVEVTLLPPTSNWSVNIFGISTSEAQEFTMRLRSQGWSLEEIAYHAS